MEDPDKAPLDSKGDDDAGQDAFPLGTGELLMEEGDCIYRDSSVPHYGLPVGKEDVKWVMVIYVPE